MVLGDEIYPTDKLTNYLCVVYIAIPLVAPCSYPVKEVPGNGCPRRRPRRLLCTIISLRPLRSKHRNNKDTEIWGSLHKEIPMSLSRVSEAVRLTKFHRARILIYQPT
jgi:hypothetical protein